VKSYLKVVHSSENKTVPLLLEIDSLGKSFDTSNGHLSVLEDVSFGVRRGEIICILGRSGCGKTTLLNLLAGFLSPDCGSIRLDGKNVERPGSECSVIFQEAALFPWLTVRENIAFGLKHQKIKKRKQETEVERFIDLVGLNGFADYRPDQISGGMKQRVALARVLILKPKMLLLDEPFAALDRQTREEMQNLLLDLCRQQNHTVVFVTHDVDEAVLLADRILLFDKSSHGIRADLPVPLVRPRERHSHTFVNLYTHVVSITNKEEANC
jgi:NitT/TauT family transport system ATP-binding protein